VYKIINGLTPAYLQTILLPDIRYRLNLRNADNVYVRCRLSKFKKSFGIVGVRNWNQLPIFLRNKPSIESFKANYKKHFFPVSRPEFNYGKRKTGINLTRLCLSFTVLHHVELLTAPSALTVNKNLRHMSTTFSGAANTTTLDKNKNLFNLVHRYLIDTKMFS
jgi:hypothetical protein